MTRRRRDFGFGPASEPADGQAGTDFPVGKAAENDPGQGPALRRGPMASAVREAAGALAERAAAEAAIRAENDALAEELVRLRAAGLVTERVPLARIRATRLVRDRAPGPDPDLADLAASIRAVGLSNPVRLEAQPDGSFELVEGFRRLAAFRQLHAETGDPTFAAIPAAFVPEGTALPGLYRRMVDENLVRKDISFAEMAALARAYAADPATGCPDAGQAVDLLYGSAGAQKRSYIRAFVELLDRIGDRIAHPAAIPRALGLAVRRRIEAEPGALAALRDGLAGLGGGGAEAEIALLEAFARGAPAEEAAAAPAPRPGLRAARTRLDLATGLPGPAGLARCTLADGRIEIRTGLDFGGLDRARLDRALAAFFRALGS